MNSAISPKRTIISSTLRIQPHEIRLQSIDNAQKSEESSDAKENSVRPKRHRTEEGGKRPRTLVAMRHAQRPGQLKRPTDQPDPQPEIDPSFCSLGANHGFHGISPSMLGEICGYFGY
jgi:hypothetical protein